MPWPGGPRQIDAPHRSGVARGHPGALTERMRITKHEHACLRLEQEGRLLIIDPGGFTLPLDDLHGLTAVVITAGTPRTFPSTPRRASPRRAPR